MDFAGNVLLVHVNLQQQCRKEFRLVEDVLVLPEELAPVDNLPVAQVEQVERHHGRFGIDAKDVGVVVFGGGHLLPLLDFLDGGQ